MGEDVEIYWRLSGAAKRKKGYLYFIEHPEVVTSSRRFDEMSLRKTLCYAAARQVAEPDAHYSFAFMIAG
jgi:hypothetical protein